MPVSGAGGFSRDAVAGLVRVGSPVCADLAAAAGVVAVYGIIWLPMVFVTLLVASGIWRYLARETKGLLVPILTHAVADLGVVLAVRALVGG